MNPGEPPPSLSSSAVRRFDQENLQVDPMAINDSYNPALSFSGHFPGQGISFVSDESFNRGLNDQPPSTGAVRPFMGSQTSGGVNNYPSAQPPSFNDVRGQQASQTGPLFNGNPITEEEALAGVSLTASDFKRIDPNAFQKDN